MKRVSLLLLIAIVTMAFSFQERDVRFKYCRVEVIYEDGGMVTHTSGVIRIKERVVIMVSNNEKPDVIFIIDREVAPEREGHSAWLVYNHSFPDTPLILEYGEGQGVKIQDIETKAKSFFFDVGVEDQLPVLPEDNVWFVFPKGGGDLKRLKDA